MCSFGAAKVPFGVMSSHSEFMAMYKGGCFGVGIPVPASFGSSKQ